MNPIVYIIQDLHDYNFSSTEITDFLSKIYICFLKEIDLESYFSYLHNDKYRDAYYLFLDDIYELPMQYWIEWYNSLS